jgi:hypothetical protein
MVRLILLMKSFVRAVGNVPPSGITVIALLIALILALKV